MRLVDPDEVKAIRKRLGLTQKELAAAIGVHPVTVATWESGRYRVPEPTARLLQHLARDAPVKKRRK